MTRKYKLTRARVLEAIEDDRNAGFCLACGAEAEGVEPDAREYECEACGAARVFGAEELALTLGLAA